jgi:hypothetical protein
MNELPATVGPRVKVKDQVFVCNNSKCEWFGERRRVGPIPIGPDLFSHIPNPYCVCGHETYQIKESNGQS